LASEPAGPEGAPSPAPRVAETPPGPADRGGRPGERPGRGWRGAPAAAVARAERYAVGRVLVGAARGFARDQAFSHAAALTYYGIFSLFPLILLAMALAGLVLQSSEAARERILALVATLLPAGQEALGEAVAGVVEAKGPAAGVGVLALLWSALVWFSELDATINQIWGVGKPRSPAKVVLLALGLAVGTGGVALASFAASAAVAVLARLAGGAPGGAGLWQAAVSALSTLAIGGVFCLLYRYAPQRRVRFADVWPAALGMAAVWEATRRLLALYLEQAGVISGYGPVGAAMALLVWLYAASAVVLAGAELSYATAKERRHIGPERELAVIAPPGEQPTPKFAPQVGRGFTAPIDEDEPIRAAAPSRPPGPGRRLPTAPESVPGRERRAG
jgi:membrane protein